MAVGSSATELTTVKQRKSVSTEEKNFAPQLIETLDGEQLQDPDFGLSAEEIARADEALVRKLDRKLIPWLTLLYLAAFLDRTNIGNAKLDGLLTDLHMTSGQYNASLSVFFVSYSVFEPLTNIALKRFRPALFLTTIMVLWGICMMCMGFVKNFSGLAAVRFFLGLAEAGLFPGVQYYLSCWYKREEYGKRAAVFFSAAALAGSFGGLLAAAIAKMKGLGGLPGWAWIFILEGLATIVIGFATYWMVHDFPAEAHFLSDQERARVLKRLRADGQASADHEELNTKYLKQAFVDWKTYAYSIVYMGADMPLYAFSLFLPTIISELGTYSATRANLLTVPPYACAAVMTITIGWLADRTRQRGLFNIGCSAIAMVGFAMLLGSQNANVKYAGTFLGAIGIYPCIPNTIVWAGNNVEGVYKRGVVLGTLIGWGNLEGIVSSNVYRAKDKPEYHLGHGIVLAYLTLFCFGGSIVTRFMLASENKKRRSGLRDHWAQGLDVHQMRELGDMRPDFIYTL